MKLGMLLRSIKISWSVGPWRMRFEISQWVGGGRSLGENQMRMQIQGQQGLAALVGRRNFNLSRWRDRFDGASGKGKESVKRGAGRAETAELSVWKPVNTTVIGCREAVDGEGKGMAKFGFLALAAAMVTAGGISPDAVYRMAMRKLNTPAPVLEVMGAPLTGTEVRAYVTSGGGLRIKNFRPRLSNKRRFIMFPIAGSEGKGLVSIEVKRRRGQYHLKLLAVDIPTAGADHRVYLVGDEQEYQVGGGLISVLRDPIVKAMAAQKEFEDHDEKEELEAIQRQWEGEQVLERETIEKLERDAAAAEQAEEEASEKELQKSLEEAKRLRN